ncbi:uncharacterized protein [Miscanthus floridulus]|uniref:uncharacterized protein isoform X2 n=1 Tax=Miscanthus floridulus TaxID=154761 RepID=UPI00345937FC
MALLVLRGCAAPAVHAAPAGSRLLPPPPPRRRRPVAVASAASSAPSGEVASSSQDVRGYGIVGGPNGNAVAPAPATKSTVVETTVERVRLLPIYLLHRLLLASRVFYRSDATAAGDLRFPVPGTPRRRRVTRRLHPVLPQYVYLAGTVMLIFGMGLYGLFISNASADVPSESDRALSGSSMFGMFALKERPKWMKITSLDELKTKVGHVIVMILLVKMFERSKMVTIATGLDLLSYSICIFLSSASLYILHMLHKGDPED